MQPKRRKIPVPKRHFGIKDPLKQLAERNEKIKDKINNPPKQRDFQEVSNSFRRFVQLKDNAKNGLPNRMYKNNYKKKEAKKLQFGDTYVEQLPKEPEEAFLARAEKKNKDRINEAKFAAKFNVDVVRNEETGTIQLKKRPKHEIDELLKNKKMGKREVKREKKIEQKKQEKVQKIEKEKTLKKKKEDMKKKEEDRLLNEFQFEKIEFGEVVHCPPSLNTKPRKAQKSEGAPRPGRKHLLLHSVINPDSEVIDQEPQETRPKKKKLNEKSIKIDKTGKRKNLPAQTRIHLEKEQKNMMELYRQLKKQKNINKT